MRAVGHAVNLFSAGLSITSPELRMSPLHACAIVYRFHREFRIYRFPTFRASLFSPDEAVYVLNTRWTNQQRPLCAT